MSTEGITSIHVIEEVARSYKKLWLYVGILSEYSVENIWHSGELTTDQCKKLKNGLRRKALQLHGRHL